MFSPLTSAAWQLQRAACRTHTKVTSRSLMLAMWERGLKAEGGVGEGRWGTCSLWRGQQLASHLFGYKFSHCVSLEALGADESLGPLASVGLLRGQDRPEHGLPVPSGHICVRTAQLLRGRQSWSKLLSGARKRASQRQLFLESHVDRFYLKTLPPEQDP